MKSPYRVLGLMLCLASSGCVSSFQKCINTGQTYEFCKSVDDIDRRDRAEYGASIFQAFSNFQPAQTPAYVPPPVYKPLYQPQTHTNCVPNGLGGMNCTTY